MVTTRGLEIRKREERCWAEAEPDKGEGGFPLSVRIIVFLLCFSIPKSVIKSLSGWVYLLLIT